MTVTLLSALFVICILAEFVIFFIAKYRGDEEIAKLSSLAIGFSPMMMMLVYLVFLAA